MKHYNPIHISGAQALLRGTIIGWSCVFIIDLITLPMFLYNDMSVSIWSIWYQIGFYYIILGFPFALFSTFIIGGPIWVVIKRRPQVSIRSAITLGLVMGAIFGAINIMLFAGSYFGMGLVLDWLSTTAVWRLGWVGWLSTCRKRCKLGGSQMLYLAAALTIFIGLVHSYLGDRYLIRPILKLDTLPVILGSRRATGHTLRFAWHITSIAWWGLAGLMIVMAVAPDQPLMQPCGCLSSSLASRGSSRWRWAANIKAGSCF